MSKPTLPQAISLLSRVQDKDLSLARLEAHFDTGLISDLLDVDPRKVDRAEFRKVIGHPDALPVPEEPKVEPTVIELGEFEADYGPSIAEKLKDVTDSKCIGWRTDWATDEKFSDVRKGKKRFKASAVCFRKNMPQEGVGSVETWCKENKKILASPKEGIDLAKVSPRPKLDNVMPLAMAGQFFVDADRDRRALYFRRDGAERHLGLVWLNPGERWAGHWWFLVLEELPSAA